MQRKLAGIWKIGPEIRNSLELGKRRGGAGAVAAALAACIVLCCIAVPAGAKAPSHTVPDGEPQPALPDHVVPWEKQPVPETAPVCHGALPSRLPC